MDGIAFHAGRRIVYMDMLGIRKFREILKKRCGKCRCEEEDLTEETSRFLRFSCLLEHFDGYFLEKVVPVMMLSIAVSVGFFFMKFYRPELINEEIVLLARILCMIVLLLHLVMVLVVKSVFGTLGDIFREEYFTGNVRKELEKEKGND